MPPLKIRVTVSEDHYGDAIAELNRTGALLVSMERHANNCLIDAEAPAGALDGLRSWLARVDPVRGSISELQ